MNSIGDAEGGQQTANPHQPPTRQAATHVAGRADGTKPSKAVVLKYLRRRRVRPLLDRYYRYMTVTRPLHDRYTTGVPHLCDYVFMCFLPSFLRSRGGAVTRIYSSSYRRFVVHAHHHK